MSHEKLCIWCKKCSWAEVSYIYYSTLTGGKLDGGLHCKEGHFDEWGPQKWDCVEDFREAILRASTCPEYEEVLP